MERFDEKELNAVAQVIRSGELSRFFTSFNGGKEVQAFEQDFANYIGCRYAISCMNGTVSLEIALQAMRIKRGQEVITTPLSFIATGTAILRVGAKPVFVDVEKKTLNIDPDKIEEAITPKTRAIIPVSLCGMPCRMYAINEIAEDHNLFVLEDAAQALGSSINHQKIGTFGTCGSFSFQESKSISTLGEGGMIITNDVQIAERAKNHRNHGNQYGTLDDVVCSNARLTEAQAAFGIVQLQKLEAFNKIHRRNSEVFLHRLKSPFRSAYSYIPNGYKQNCYLIPIIAEGVNREKFIAYLEEKGVSKKIPGQNIGYWKRLIYENKIFQSNPRANLPYCLNAEWARDNVLLIDIHRWNKTAWDMHKYAKIFNSYIEAN